ncbi:MAG: ArsR/SmtB family transcription factor [Gemmatimonadota bacterium]
MIRTASPLFGQLAALADPTRGRMLLLLEQQALTVSEVCSVMQLPQSTVSRHLKVLVDEDWASGRAEGASRLYRLRALQPPAKRIWETVRTEIAGSVAGRQDRQRLRAVLDVRRNKSAAFFSAAAGDWERVRLELFGTTAELLPLLALLDADMTVGDLGCGTGQIARALAPFVGRVIGVDASAAMLQAAQARPGENLELRKGELEDLPVADGELDAALLFLVLHYVVNPERALREAARTLEPGGRLLLVDMMPHDREKLRETMGHVWSGFSAGQLTEWLGAAGFERIQYIPLPVDPRAQGPALFCVRCTIPDTQRSKS